MNSFLSLLYLIIYFGIIMLLSLKLVRKLAALGPLQVRREEGDVGLGLPYKVNFVFYQILVLALASTALYLIMNALIGQ